MKKRLVTKELIENIPELEHLPEGKVLLLGPELKESGIELFFNEREREVVIDEGNLQMGGNDYAYEEFALVILDEAMALREYLDLERLFLELNSTLTDEGVLVAFFSCESAVEEIKGAFYTNREIEQMVSGLLTVERIATMMDGSRRAVARKHVLSVSSP